MAIDTPATIAILGAGPLGLEAALYARYLGYDAQVFERGEVAAGLVARSPQDLPPWAECVSKLGLAALRAQDSVWRPPSLEARPTAAAWRDRYLRPLALSDLLVDSVREYAEALSVRLTPTGEARRDAGGDSAANAARGELPIAEPAGEEPAGDEMVEWLEPDQPLEPNFEVVWRSTRGDGSLEVFPAHVVIDASGIGPTDPASAVDEGERAASGIALWSSDGGRRRRVQRRAQSGVALTTRGPNFFLLGAAALPPGETAIGIPAALGDIRALFALVGGRDSLDLYATMDKLLP